MTDITYLSTDNNRLVQQLQSAEKSIAFIQREHAATLSNLHEEITKWQQKCSELTFQIAIGGGTVINSPDDSKLRSTIERLEKEIDQCKETINNLNKLLEEKEKQINDYENRFIVNERKHGLELRQEYDKQRQLKIELEQRSTLIAQLTNQLHREKQIQQQLQTRSRLGQFILPNKPPKMQNDDESTTVQQHEPYSLPAKRLSNRSSSLNGRASPNQDLTLLLVKRRPPTPPQQLRPLSSQSIQSNDEQLYTKRQRQLLNSHTETVDSNKVALSRSSIKRSTHLPPIGNKTMPLKALSTTIFQQEGEA